MPQQRRSRTFRQAIGTPHQSLAQEQVLTPPSPGGCFAVQQTDVEPTVNTASSVRTFKDGAGILQQVQGNLQGLANGKAANVQQGLLDAASASAHADEQLLASFQSKIYPETAQPEQAKGAGVTRATTAPAAVPTSGSAVPTAPALASPVPSAAPGAGSGAGAGTRPGARPGAGAGGRQGGAGGQRPPFPGAGTGPGTGAGAGNNLVFLFPTRVPGGGNNKRSSFNNGMRWARRFV